ncbi:MAG: hypothetical protein GYA48_10675 [Chloroflexi bacterium]|nr:hypothetical protein [Chloroflexota bacterium]
MYISGPNLPSQTTTPLDNSEVNLRANQQIEAQVLRVNGQQVVISVQGVPVVARMTSAEQAAVLVEHRLARFIVQDVDNKTLVLQLVSADANAQQAPAVRIAPADLTATLLDQAGIALTQSNLAAARAALGQGLLLTPALIHELTQALEQLPNWTEQDARIAAALKAAGLPITPESIRLAQSTPAALLETFNNLAQQLRGLLSRSGLPQDLYQQALRAEASLRSLILQAGSPEELQQALKDITSRLGKSMENTLLSQINQTANGESALSELSRLHAMLGQGRSALTESLDRFMETVRWNHFMNIPENGPLQRAIWTGVDIPILLPAHPQGQPNQNQLSSLHIRVAGDPDADHLAVNPAYTRLVIQTELPGGEILSVDLSMVHRQVNAEVTSTDTEVGEIAEELMPTLQDGLSHHGFQIVSSSFKIKHNASGEEIKRFHPLNLRLKPVNLKV